MKLLLLFINLCNLLQMLIIKIPSEALRIFRDAELSNFDDWFSLYVSNKLQLLFLKLNDRFFIDSNFRLFCLNLSGLVANCKIINAHTSFWSCFIIFIIIIIDNIKF